MSQLGVQWTDSTDVLIGEICVSYPDRDSLERDLHEFWGMIPAESKTGSHERVRVIVRDRETGREFYLDNTFLYDECILALDRCRSEERSVDSHE